MMNVAVWIVPVLPRVSAAKYFSVVFCVNVRVWPSCSRNPASSYSVDDVNGVEPSVVYQMSDGSELFSTRLIGVCEIVPDGTVGVTTGGVVSSANFRAEAIWP